jgi:uncharacterized membrane protein
MILGYLQISLARIDGKPGGYSDLFRSLRSGPGFLLAGLGYLAITSVGLILLLIPGLYWGSKYGFWGFFLASEGSEVGLGYRRSAEITQGVKGKLVGYSLLLFLINILGAALLGLGLVVTVPITVLTYASLFRILTVRSDEPLGEMGGLG